jgi:hypothetical protein
MRQSWSQAFGVAEEIKILYSENFAIELVHVESEFEADPESPDQLPERTEYKVYLLLVKPCNQLPMIGHKKPVKLYHK